MNEKRKLCMEQENRFQFCSFSQNDAKDLGDMLYQTSLSHSGPVAIEITLNHLVIYRFFPDGTNRNNELWLRAKANTVEMLGISSFHFAGQLEDSGETQEEKRMPRDTYAACGGGFPIRLKEGAVIGSICVSGLPDWEDHQVIVETLEAYFQKRGWV